MKKGNNSNDFDSVCRVFRLVLKGAAAPNCIRERPNDFFICTLVFDPSLEIL